jgi:hypothetical protein
VIGTDFRRALFRTCAAALLACLPILALLLVPSLMRSRAGSETLLAIGSTLFVILVVAAILAAPVLSAVAAPLGHHWKRGTVRATVRELRRTRPRAFWWTIGEFFAILLVSQLAGLAVALVAPYVASNPAHATDPAAPAWIIDYPNYALQACVIYVVICFAVAWYGTRLRDLPGGEENP